MTAAHPAKPVVMCFSGLDPSGGAGITADIETLAALGCHCAPIVTTLTVQDSRNVREQRPVAADWLLRQAEVVLADMPVAGFKVGLLGSVAAVEALAELLARHRSRPVVLDPVLAAGGGYRFGDDTFAAALRELLVPLATVVTPNTQELQALAPGLPDDNARARHLLGLGCGHVLLTGTHAEPPRDSEIVVNRCFGATADPVHWTWARLDGVYHGSGCTLAAAVAAGLARGQAVIPALAAAQQHTWNALRHAQSLGRGQLFPNRGGATEPCGSQES